MELMEFRISGSTNANSLGSCIERCMSEGKKVILYYIGVRASNQAEKGMAIASRLSREAGRGGIASESFFDSKIDEDSKEKLVRMKFDVFYRKG